MNMNGIVGRFGRVLTGALMGWGIKKGVDVMARRNGGEDAKGKLTAKGRQQAHATREAVKRARKAAQIARRMSR
ncbi:hypothetical protein ACFHYO_14900 [Paracoccus panacisoli]|uniref:Uncharacterized protein n=2 Tax=Paracoccus TaxID=265 RepID=A0A099G894_9RHOB|nr:hypothetical protein [Paracoccus sanguinis]KGJ15014.1 hypothetical protein IX54_03930 [Paracoccus sanguinis]KGJ18985.1 hypothetical protein IX57_02025 [Paracoccus sanguinis]KGJ21209.1 hypothetical protein IX55_03045 [Paracoccus sanguinis]KGJ23719.1 hypothetical protein IX56_00065 [Paracoccus sanguinis]QJD17638.1 hypothetical protein HGN31_12710 [Paracoccus sanguinis]